MFEQVKFPRLGETLYTAEHSSGLKVFVMPKPGFSKSYAVLSTKYGSIDNAFYNKDGTAIEVPDGIAHFLEHKMFDQPDGTNVFSAFAKKGASPNAFTAFNKTSYLFSCTGDFYGNLEILLDYVYKPYFTDESVSKEQGIIGQEINMYRDDANWRSYFGLLEALYSDFPIRRDIAGTIESISHITKELLYDCHKTFYNPSNMYLFTIGTVEPEKVMEYVDKYVTAEPSGEIKRLYAKEPRAVCQPEVVCKLSVAYPKFYIGFKDNDTGYGGKQLHKKIIGMSLLLELLFGQSSAFYEKLYNDGTINSSFGTQYDNDIYYAHAIVGGESKEPYKVCDEVLAAIADIQIDEADFERTRKAFIGKFIKQFNGVEWLANTFVDMLMNDVDLFDYLDLINEIDTNYLKQLANSVLQKENMAVSIVEPNA